MYHTEEENKHTQSPSLTHKHAFTHPVIALDTHQNWQGNGFLYLVTKKCILTSVNLLPLAPSDAKISWTETQTHKTLGRGSPFKAHSHPPLLPFHKIWTWGSALKRLHREIAKYRYCFVRGGGNPMFVISQPFFWLNSELTNIQNKCGYELTRRHICGITFYGVV